MDLMNQRRHGLTLIEILVVFGIITTLLALAGGAAMKVSRKARSSVCRSNLRQLALATASYRNVNDDGLPAAILYYDETGGTRTEAWDFVQSADGTIKPGSLWSYIDGPQKVNQCPSYTGSSNFGADPYTGYNYNTSFLGAEGHHPWTDQSGRRVQGWQAARRGLPPSSHQKPDRCALFGDGGWKGGANKFMRGPMNSVEYDIGLVYAGGQAFRHQGCCNIVHLDGHCSVATDPWEGTHASSWLLENVMSYPENAFLSEDDTAYDPR
jgi:type II secretory pathway pseudopilin PulG